ncbi:MAG: transglycosylase SLT domain-containing protein [Candidatus Solibacter sp.]|nr:transglycosylase SLT domain-containing protein [Candidatus Solibacter sp.]
MTIRTCSAALILALSYSSLGAAPTTGALAMLVRAYRESPSPVRRSAVASYIAGHPKDAALANLALGIAAYEHKNWAAAIAGLKPLLGKLAPIDDYTAYYLALARVESNDFEVTAADLAAVRRNSPLTGKSWLVEARALKGSSAAGAVRLLREHYDELPQPEGDVILADCYQAANDLAHAAEFYQRVYYNYLTGAAALRAAAGMLTLQDAMGRDYPPPGAAQMLHRAGRLMEAKEYAQARKAYQATAAQTGGAEREQALVRMAAADFLAGKTALAWPYLRGLQVADPEAAAERLYYLAECARRRNDDEYMMSAVRQLAARYKQSPWRLKALTSAANRFLLLNQAEDYVPLYQAVYQDFPGAPPAALSHWKVTFHAYLHGQADAFRLLREHLRQYPGHSTAGSALYFLGRYFERSGDLAGARACYQRLANAFENHYYAMLARERLKTAASPAPATAITGEIAQFVAGIPVSAPGPVAAAAAAATQTRIERSRLLRAAGLSDLADAELRFGIRTDGQPALLAMELADSADAPHQAMRIMKSTSPEYMSLPVPAAPRKFWELLFPLPYRADVLRNAQQRDLDPYLLAGLIRQESEFNPQAVSGARAYGLTQIRPATGRQFARQAGVSKVTTRVLYQPAANLKIGSSILRSMLDRQGGKVEQTLAAYNAGPHRVVEWMAWGAYREPAEFVESIPFTETRDYVQAVLRNAEMYRRLYQ